MHDSTLDHLQCPITRTRLRIVDDATLHRVNASIAAGAVRNADDEIVDSEIESGLVNEERTWLYPIRNGIPSLLVDEAIDLLSLASAQQESD